MLVIPSKMALAHCHFLNRDWLGMTSIWDIMLAMGELTVSASFESGLSNLCKELTSVRPTETRDT